MSSHAYPDWERIRSSSFVSGKTFPEGGGEGRRRKGWGEGGEWGGGRLKGGAGEAEGGGYRVGLFGGEGGEGGFPSVMEERVFELEEG